MLHGSRSERFPRIHSFSWPHRFQIAPSIPEAPANDQSPAVIHPSKRSLLVLGSHFTSLSGERLRLSAGRAKKGGSAGVLVLGCSQFGWKKAERPGN